MNIDTEFNAAYWLHQPKPVRPLQSIADISDRAALADTLAQEGFIIDPPIMVQGWPPFMVMSFRKQIGQAWEHPLGKPPVLVSALPPAVVTDFNAPPPPYAILTSTDIKNYPPIDPVVIVLPPALSDSPIRAFAYVNDAGQDVHFSNPDDISPNGAVWPGPDATPRYVKTVRQTPFGKAQSWTKVA